MCAYVFPRPLCGASRPAKSRRRCSWLEPPLERWRLSSLFCLQFRFLSFKGFLQLLYCISHCFIFPLYLFLGLASCIPLDWHHALLRICSSVSSSRSCGVGPKKYVERCC